MEPIADRRPEAAADRRSSSEAAEAAVAGALEVARAAVRLTVSEVDEVELAEAAELLGPADELVAACSMDLTGPLDRSDPAGLRGPLGPGPGRPAAAPAARDVDVLGRARAVGRQGDDQHRRLRLPQRAGGPPPARRPAAGRERAAASRRRRRSATSSPASLLEFALMDQAMEADRVLLVTEPVQRRAGPSSTGRCCSSPSGESLRTSGLVAGRTPNLRDSEEDPSVPSPPSAPTPAEIVSVPIGRWAVAAAPAQIRTLLGLVRGGRALRPGGPARRRWPTSCCPTRGGRPTTPASSPTRRSPP